jgi:hypothetical protein
MEEIWHLDSLKGYDEIMITGGEPTMAPVITGIVTGILRENNPDAKIYLYTASYTSLIDRIIHRLDGVHYTLHTFTSEDREKYLGMCRLAARYRGKKSFRLYIQPTIDKLVEICPCLWARVEVKPWIGPDEMCLPEGEKLFVLGPEWRT